MSPVLRAHGLGLVIDHDVIRLQLLTQLADEICAEPDLPALAQLQAVRWDGEDLSDVPSHRRSFGLVFQDEQLFPHRTVGENVAFGLRMQRRPKHEQARRVDELLALVGLTGFADRSVINLSGGEAKRVALARALAPEPRLLLLDEPLTGLDRELHDRLAGEVRRVLTGLGTTALLVTHDRRLLDSVAFDRIFRVEAGYRHVSDGQASNSALVSSPSSTSCSTMP